MNLSQNYLSSSSKFRWQMNLFRNYLSSSPEKLVFLAVERHQQRLYAQPLLENPPIFFLIIYLRIHLAHMGFRTFYKLKKGRIVIIYNYRDASVIYPFSFKLAFSIVRSSLSSSCRLTAESHSADKNHLSRRRYQQKKTQN